MGKIAGSEYRKYTSCRKAEIKIEDAFKGSLPYFLYSLVVLALLVLFPDLWLAIPAAVFPDLF